MIRHDSDIYQYSYSVLQCYLGFRHKINLHLSPLLNVLDSDSVRINQHGIYTSNNKGTYVGKGSL